MALNLAGSLLAGAVTPMTGDYLVDLDGAARYFDWLAGQAPTAMAINVDVSEGPHLSRSEKASVLEVARDIVGERTGIVAGVSSTYTAAAIEEADDAQRIGADALQVFPVPAFHGEPLPPDLVLSHLERLSNSTDLPMIVVHLGRRIGGPGFSTEILQGLATIRNVVGVKEASWNLDDFRHTVEVLRGTRVAVLTGNDRLFPESLVHGAVGALIGLGTVGVAEQLELIRLGLDGRYTEMFEIGKRLQPLADVLFADPLRDARARTKVALQLLGILDQVTVRPPLFPVGEEVRENIEQALAIARLQVDGRTVRD